jgi:hypothetical protein
LSRLLPNSNLLGLKWVLPLFFNLISLLYCLYLNCLGPLNPLYVSIFVYSPAISCKHFPYLPPKIDFFRSLYFCSSCMIDSIIVWVASVFWLYFEHFLFRTFNSWSLWTFIFSLSLKLFCFLSIARANNSRNCGTWDLSDYLLSSILS